MTTSVTARMEKRAREIHARLAVRAWEYRQRNLAHGEWFKPRWALMKAKEAWEMPESGARRLIASGVRPLDAGARLEPSKTLLVVDAKDVETVDGRVPLPLLMNERLLAARWILLVPFENALSKDRGSDPEMPTGPDGN
jgi:hypothetical protein